LWWASRVYENAGELEKALHAYQLYLLRTMSVNGRNPVMDPSGLIRLEALVACEKGEIENALDALRRFNQISPYEFDIAGEIVEAIQEHGQAEAVEGAGLVLETYWRAKMLEMPKCKAYANSLEHWVQFFGEL